MKQVIYQEKLAAIRQKKLLWGDLDFWCGLGFILVGIILLFKIDFFGQHPYTGWGIFLIIGGIICVTVGRHFISQCNREYEETLQAIENEEKGEKVRPPGERTSMARRTVKGSKNNIDQDYTCPYCDNKVTRNMKSCPNCSRELFFPEN